MSVYDPSGSNNVHMSQSISGKKKATPKKAPGDVPMKKVPKKMPKKMPKKSGGGW